MINLNIICNSFLASVRALSWRTINTPSLITSLSHSVFGSLHFLCQLASQNQHYLEWLDSDSGKCHRNSVMTRPFLALAVMVQSRVLNLLPW
uniref:Uncharacterized protein n=1 Tax=Salix viminalis TaxID=40686 RepID=A0A6N2M8R8_SALVM